jgi:hypothetical protein
MKLIVLTGKRFGRWLVIGEQPLIWNKETYWTCRCDCGTQRDVGAKDLRNGRSTSCGCLHSEQLAKRNYKDGLAYHPLRQRYSMMKDRCYNRANWAWTNYGGRGITVCDRWRLSFAGFLEDVLRLPGAPGDGNFKGLSLDRINNDESYSPENVRWSTPRQQCRSNAILKRPNSLHKGKGYKTQS